MVDQGRSDQTGPMGDRQGRVQQRSGTVAELHSIDPAAMVVPGVVAVFQMLPTDAALVLGSTQPADTIDTDAVASAGLSLVRRSSGGGAVAVVPADMLWVDVVSPVDAPGWTDDVDVAAHAVGQRFVEALVDLGVPRARLGVHRGASLHRPAGRIVCFAGLGSGEVTLDGQKLVGLSQRRGRWGARAQCLVHLRFDPDRWWPAIRWGEVPAPALEVAVLPSFVEPAELAARLSAQGS